MEIALIEIPNARTRASGVDKSGYAFEVFFKEGKAFLVTADGIHAGSLRVKHEATAEQGLQELYISSFPAKDMKALKQLLEEKDFIVNVRK